MDLMELVIDKPVPYTGGDVILKVAGGPTCPTCGATAIQFWAASTKGTHLAQDGGNSIKLGNWDNVNTQTVWVEAGLASAALRDIVLEASYKGAKDTVRATAIWSSVTSAHDRVPFDRMNNVFPPFPAVGAPVLGALRAANGTGLLPVSPIIGVRNSIAFRFTVVPGGVQNEPGVFFDITRRKE